MGPPLACGSTTVLSDLRSSLSEHGFAASVATPELIAVDIICMQTPTLPASGLPRTIPAARHAAASNPTARPQRLFFNGHKTGLPGGPREADPATSAPSAPVGVLPTAQSAPPTPQAMGPAAGTGGTRVWGVRCAASHGPWRGCGRGPVVRRRSRVFFARAEQASAPGAEASSLSTLNTRGPRVGEQEKKALFFDKLLMTRQQIAHPAPPMGPLVDPDHPRTCSMLGKYSWQSGTASTAAEEDRSMCR